MRRQGRSSAASKANRRAIPLARPTLEMLEERLLLAWSGDAVAVAAPDLEIDPWGPGEITAWPLKAVCLDVTVRNVGDAPAADPADPASAGQLRLYLSPDAVVGTGDPVAASAPLGRLESGQAQTECLSFLAPAVPGWYVLCAHADADDALPEPSEVNNWGALVPLRVLPAADLVVAAPTVTELVAVAGRPVSLPVQVRNTGSGSAFAVGEPYAFPGPVTYKAWNVSVLLSSDPMIGWGDGEAARFSLEALPAGASESRTLTFRAPQKQGTYYLAAVADPDDAVGETDEANNFGGIVRLTVLAPPDLGWTQFTWRAGVFGPGSPLGRLWGLVHSSGPALIEAPVVELRLSRDPVWSDDDYPVGRQSIPPISPGRDAAVAIDAVVPDIALPGDYHLLAKLDADEQVFEADESDNVWAWSAPDIAIVADMPMPSGGPAMLSIGDGRPQRVLFADAMGRIVAVSVQGRGVADVTFFGTVDGLSEAPLPGPQATLLVSGRDLSLASVVVRGGDTSTVLTVTARGGPPGGSVRLLAADSSVGRIVAPDICLTGELDIRGLAGSIWLGDVTGPHVLRVNSDGLSVGPDDAVAVTLGRVADASLDTNGLPIVSLTAAGWTRSPGAAAGRIAAPWIGRLTTTGAKPAGKTRAAKAGQDGSGGDFQADLCLTGEGLPLGQPTLGDARIAGDLGGEWGIDGLVGKVAVAGTVRGWDLHGAADFDALGLWSVKSLALGEVNDARIVALDAIGSVQAVQWLGGRIEADRLDRLTIAGREGGKAGAAVAGDFRADVVLGGRRVAADRPVLGRVNIAHDLMSSLWRIGGVVGGVTVGGTAAASTLAARGGIGALALGAADGSRFLAGVRTQQLDPVAVSAAEVDPLAEIKAIRITGLRVPRGQIAPRFVRDVGFLAGRLGTVSLLNAEAGTYALFVLDPDAGIRRLSHRDTDPAFAGGNWTWKPGSPFPAAWAGASPLHDIE